MSTTSPHSAAADDIALAPLEIERRGTEVKRARVDGRKQEGILHTVVCKVFYVTAKNLKYIITLNSLKNSSIRTLKDLVELSEDDLLKVKNVGEKALTEIGELLQREGFNFKMVFETDDEGLRIVDPGVSPATQVAGPAEAPAETPEGLGA